MLLLCCRDVLFFLKLIACFPFIRYLIITFFWKNLLAILMKMFSFQFLPFLQLEKLSFTQVLKTSDYIDVRQEEAYGDVLITLKPEPTATED
jgi:Conserved region of Rad21 / Rec8 like protein